MRPDCSIHLHTGKARPDDFESIWIHFDAKYRIDYTTNLVSWLPLRTNTAFGGTFQFEDVSSGNSPARFYRTQRVP